MRWESRGDVVNPWARPGPAGGAPIGHPPRSRAAPRPSSVNRPSLLLISTSNSPRLFCKAFTRYQQ
jgi:hypothetical protein